MSSSFSTSHGRKAKSPTTAAGYYLRRREHRERQAGYAGWPLRLEQIANRDHLYYCFQKLKRDGGLALGVDGVQAADLSPSEVGKYMEALSKAILKGEYRPQPTRPVAIPKPGSSEQRVLK